MNKPHVTFRSTVFPQDRESVRLIVESSGFFYPAEVLIAVELVNERLEKGDASGYHFLFAEIEGQTVGYACYGPIPGTKASWDLYWIAVHQEVQGKGVGKTLLRECEAAVRRAGGARLYIETSGRELYAPTRGFYLANGCIWEATLKDFYAPGDDKCIFVKVL